MRWTLDEILVAVAFFVLFYFRNWQATVLLLGVMAYLLIRYFEEKAEPAEETPEVNVSGSPALGFSVAHGRHLR